MRPDDAQRDADVHGEFLGVAQLTAWVRLRHGRDSQRFVADDIVRDLGKQDAVHPSRERHEHLAQVRDRGSTGDVYNQNSENFALFTHNILHITDNIDLTLGLRYTNETKTLDATFGNDNVFCPANRALLRPLLTNPALGGLAGGLLALSCQGNSTSELNGVSISDERDEDEFTGTAILSWKPTPDLMTYASYSRGYKAGGFNLDRSALTGTSSLGVILGPLVAGDVEVAGSI